MTKKETEMAFCMVESALQTEEWFSRVKADPYITREEAAYTEALISCSLESALDRDELEEACAAVANAYTQAAFL